MTKESYLGAQIGERCQYYNESDTSSIYFFVYRDLPSLNV